jgi:hypothetical protein
VESVFVLSTVVVVVEVVGVPQEVMNNPSTIRRMVMKHRNLFMLMEF